MSNQCRHGMPLDHNCGKCICSGIDPRLGHPEHVEVGGNVDLRDYPAAMPVEVDGLDVEITTEKLQKMQEKIGTRATVVAMCILVGAPLSVVRGVEEIAEMESAMGNPSCFKKKLGVEACNNGCPVSDECYE